MLVPYNDTNVDILKIELYLIALPERKEHADTLQCQYVTVSILYMLILYSVDNITLLMLYTC